MNYKKFWENFKGRPPGKLSYAGKKRDWHPEGHVFDAGAAKGHPQIETDSFIFRWWDEVYSVPTMKAYRFVDMRGENIFIRMKDLKKLEKDGFATRITPKEKKNGR